ncbi:DUF1109 family protein [Cystobacter fuscus]|nr:DUF1109 family protein [Cystobacter fuscus]
MSGVECEPGETQVSPGAYRRCTGRCILRRRGGRGAAGRAGRLGARQPPQGLCGGVRLLRAHGGALLAPAPRRHPGHAAPHGLPRRPGGGRGLAAGAVGLILLHVHCPDGSPGHLAVSHAGPWLVLGALAPWVRARLRTTGHAP